MRLGSAGITEGNLISYLFFVLAQILLFRWVVETLLVLLSWKQIAVGGEHNCQFLIFSSTGSGHSHDSVISHTCRHYM